VDTCVETVDQEVQAIVEQMNVGIQVEREFTEQCMNREPLPHNWERIYKETTEQSLNTESLPRTWEQIFAKNTDQSTITQPLPLNWERIYGEYIEQSTNTEPLPLNWERIYKDTTEQSINTEPLVKKYCEHCYIENIKVTETPCQNWDELRYKNTTNQAGNIDSAQLNREHSDSIKSAVDLKELHPLNMRTMLNSVLQTESERDFIFTLSSSSSIAHLDSFSPTNNKILDKDRKYVIESGVSCPPKWNADDSRRLEFPVKPELQISDVLNIPESPSAFFDRSVREPMLSRDKYDLNSTSEIVQIGEKWSDSVKETLIKSDADIDGINDNVSTRKESNKQLGQEKFRLIDSEEEVQTMTTSKVNIRPIWSPWNERNYKRMQTSGSGITATQRSLETDEQTGMGFRSSQFDEFGLSSPFNQELGSGKDKKSASDASSLVFANEECARKGMKRSPFIACQESCDKTFNDFLATCTVNSTEISKACIVSDCLGRDAVRILNVNSDNDNLKIKVSTTNNIIDAVNNIINPIAVTAGVSRVVVPDISTIKKDDRSSTLPNFSQMMNHSNLKDFTVARHVPTAAGDAVSRLSSSLNPSYTLSSSQDLKDNNYCISAVETSMKPSITPHTWNSCSLFSDSSKDQLKYTHPSLGNLFLTEASSGRAPFKQEDSSRLMCVSTTSSPIHLRTVSNTHVPLQSERISKILSIGTVVKRTTEDAFKLDSTNDKCESGMSNQVSATPQICSSQIFSPPPTNKIIRLVEQISGSVPFTAQLRSGISPFSQITNPLPATPPQAIPAAQSSCEVTNDVLVTPEVTMHAPPVINSSDEIFNIALQYNQVHPSSSNISANYGSVSIEDIPFTLANTVAPVNMPDRTLRIGELSCSQRKTVTSGNVDSGFRSRLLAPTTFDEPHASLFRRHLVASLERPGDSRTYPERLLSLESLTSRRSFYKSRDSDGLLVSHDNLVGRDCITSPDSFVSNVNLVSRNSQSLYDSLVSRDPLQSSVSRDPRQSSVSCDPLLSSVLRDPLLSSVSRNPLQSSVSREPFLSSSQDTRFSYDNNVTHNTILTGDEVISRNSVTSCDSVTSRSCLTSCHSLVSYSLSHTSSSLSLRSRPCLTSDPSNTNELFSSTRLHSLNVHLNDKRAVDPMVMKSPVRSVDLGVRKTTRGAFNATEANGVVSSLDCQLSICNAYGSVQVTGHDTTSTLSTTIFEKNAERTTTEVTISDRLEAPVVYQSLTRWSVSTTTSRPSLLTTTTPTVSSVSTSSRTLSLAPLITTTVSSVSSLSRTPPSESIQRVLDSYSIAVRQTTDASSATAVPIGRPVVNQAKRPVQTYVDGSRHVTGEHGARKVPACFLTGWSDFTKSDFVVVNKILL